MRLSKRIPAPPARSAAVPVASLLAVLLAGCATGSEYQGASWYDQQVAMEDDGLPPQAPPLHRTNTGPDDPREPFSPNYGPPIPVEKKSPSRPTIPADLPPTFRRQLASAIAI